MHLLVGLGNPGPTYEKNRHNVGFMAVNQIFDHHGFDPWKKRFHGAVSLGVIGQNKVMAFKPYTYMNDSGRAVAEVVRFYKLSTAEVIVIYDDIDLVLGKLRVKFGGGHGGHNGLRSLDQHLGKAFWRVRIGIGHPGDKTKVHGHVLGDFSPTETETVTQIIVTLAEEIAALMQTDPQKGANELMTRFALKTASPKKRRTSAPTALN